MNHSFQQWIRFPDQHPFWNERLKDPDQRDLMLQAKEILLSMDFEEKLFNDIEKEQLWKKIETTSSLTKTPHQRRASSVRGGFLIRVAAGLALLICFMAVYYLFFKDYEKDTLSWSDPTESYIDKVNPRGKKSSFQLADGSRIKLNAESILRIPEQFSEKERLVYLEGEAFFEITKDKLRPFIVVTGGVATEVLGTSFNVRAFPDEDQVKVAVIEGQVKVSQDIRNDDSPQTLSAFLEPHEMASVDKDQIIKSVFEEDKVFAWKHNTIYFDNLRFEQVVTKLERWYGVNFVINRIGGIPGRYNGRFTSLSLEKVLEGLSYSSEFQFTIEEKTIYIE